MSEHVLPDDCFALPPGVNWTPVDTSLEFLRRNLSCAVGLETVPVEKAEGRILGGPVPALRSHPAAANSAVDGFAFAFDNLENGAECRLNLMPGRAAAGQPFGSKLLAGHAVRILTGAILPHGTDSVVIDESTVIKDGIVMFRRPRRKGLNTRPAGEDIRQGDRLLAAGQRLGAGAIGHLVAAGVDRVDVRKRLRVGVMSTGKELRTAGCATADEQVLDANRPMLLALMARWGFEPVDIGISPDDADIMRRRLAGAVEQVDAFVTSGGVSTGDEDHVARLLSKEAQLSTWRIAVKPGRPLALAVWKGRPVFGLPGNPVAAFVCSLIFVLPALRLLAGGGWSVPKGFMAPAAFEKDKKAGRHEYLRARLNEVGEVEAFRSEGSGLTSGLAWSDGLVELDDGPNRIRMGDPVRYLPYSGFGI